MMTTLAFNELSNSMLKKAGQKSRNLLPHPGWKNLHIKAGQKLSDPVFYPTALL